jgi:hypothetical protein
MTMPAAPPVAAPPEGDPAIPPGSVVIPPPGTVPSPPTTEFGPGTTPAGVPSVPAPTVPGAPTPTIPADLLQDPAVQAAIEAARREEKDKLYKRLEQQGQALASLQEESNAAKAEREAAEQVERDRIEAERRSRLSAEQMIEEERTRFAAERADFAAQQANMAALFEREQQAMRVESFKARRLAEEQANIAPQFLGYITGNTEEELEASISVAKANTQSIFQEVAAAGIAQRQAARGVAPTGAPPAGPMDTTTGYQVLTPADLAEMDHATYMQNRGALLEAASNAAKQGRLYGG